MIKSFQIILSGKFIFSAIKNLKNLELLTFDRNFICSVPDELLDCTKIFQISFDGCSRLFSVPNQILMMPNLVNVSFRGCNLLVFPSMIPENIKGLLVSGNQLLTSIPDGVLRFLEIGMTLAEFYGVEERDVERLIKSQ